MSFIAVYVGRGDFLPRYNIGDRLVVTNVSLSSTTGIERKSARFFDPYPGNIRIFVMSMIGSKTGSHISNAQRVDSSLPI